MKTRVVRWAWLPFLACQLALAQTAPSLATSAQASPAVEDFKPSPLAQSGRQYPAVNSERRVRTRIVAPQATKVELDISAVRYPLTKGEDGAWIGESRPQDEGFHYYQIWVDGAAVPDPNSLYFYGASRWGSGVEVPAHDQDFYAVKDVPHGQIRSVLFFSKSTNLTQHCFVYTPPDYDKDQSRRYPVLYLQHGGGEDENGWASQGFTNRIMDNLIAEGKGKPFIIVMANSYVYGTGAPGGRGGGPGRGTAPAGRGGAMGPAVNQDGLILVGTPAGAPGTGGPGAGAPGGAGRRGGRGLTLNVGPFQTVLLDELIPYIDANFRTLADQSHRAMAGLSMGGMYTHTITMTHLDKFSHMGLFSGGTIAPTEITDKSKVKLVFMSYGSREGGAATVKDAADALNQAGVKSAFYVSPDTAHEWLSWRRALREFAPLLFQD